MNILQQISSNKLLKKPVIYGILGLELSDEEKYFFKENGCVGFILFARNIKDKIQLKKLTDSMRELMEGEILILIDQEGGRVARMTEPHWNVYPSGEFFADLYLQDQKRAKKMIYDNFAQIAFDLNEVGINVNCAPLLDLNFKETHRVIGDRAYGQNINQVCDLAQSVCDGLLSKEIYPVIKHIPGHGRATCDSHIELPRVDADIESLRSQDFEVFKRFTCQKFAMTAHILYSAIDNLRPATSSKEVVDLIRGEIGFKNILMTDDLSMKALKGSFFDRVKESLGAGCDLILHCNGNMEEMKEINSALPEVEDSLRDKFVD